MSQDQKNNSNEEVEILDHEYDGIQEYDNPLPNWWLVSFFGTIIFAFLYYLHYSFGGGPTLTQELEVAMKDLPKAEEQVWGEDELKAKMDSPDLIAKGKAVFAGKCAACHGNEGQGVIGPNLTDKFWLHGGHRADILRTINKGVTEKGMPSWAGMLNDDEMMQVAGFVYSLRQTHPANGKAPQGEEVKE
jgi:cytochrome c oxidase cbb3-type subunit 3